MEPSRDIGDMLAGMAPRLEPATYVFATEAEPSRIALAAPLARGMFREAEGTSLILERSDARRMGHVDALPMRCITLGLHSALDGVGLTAAVAEALARDGIACNVVAAFHHDHVFVPAINAEAALRCLKRVRDAAADRDSADV